MELAAYSNGDQTDYQQSNMLVSHSLKTATLKSGGEVPSNEPSVIGGLFKQNNAQATSPQEVVLTLDVKESMSMKLPKKDAQRLAYGDKNSEQPFEPFKNAPLDQNGEKVLEIEPAIESRNDIDANKVISQQQRIKLNHEVTKSSIDVSTQSLLQNNSITFNEDSKDKEKKVSSKKAPPVPPKCKELDDYLQQHLLKHALVATAMAPEPTPLFAYSNRYLGLDTTAAHLQTEVTLHKKSRPQQSAQFLPKLQLLQQMTALRSHHASSQQLSSIVPAKHVQKSFTPYQGATIQQAEGNVKNSAGGHFESIISSDAMLTPVGYQHQETNNVSVGHVRGLSSHTFGRENDRLPSAGQHGKMNVTGKFEDVQQTLDPTEAPSAQPSTVRLDEMSARDKFLAMAANAEYQMQIGQMDQRMERVPVYSRQNNDDVSFRATNQSMKTNQLAMIGAGGPYQTNESHRQASGQYMSLNPYDSIQSYAAAGGNGHVQSTRVPGMTSIVSVDTGRKTTSIGPFTNSHHQSNNRMISSFNYHTNSMTDFQTQYQPLSHSSAQERFLELQSQARDREDKLNGMNQRLLAKFIKRTDPEARMVRKLERQLMRQQHIEQALNNGCLILNAKAARQHGTRHGAQTELSSYLEYRGKKVTEEEKQILRQKNRERRYLEKVLRRHQRAQANSQMEKIAPNEDQPEKSNQFENTKASIERSEDGKFILSRRIQEVSRSAEDSNVRVTPKRRSGTESIPQNDNEDSRREYATQSEALKHITAVTSLGGQIKVKTALKARASVPQRRAIPTEHKKATTTNSDLAVLKDATLEKTNLSAAKAVNDTQHIREFDVISPKADTGTSESKSVSRATFMPHKFSGLKSIQQNETKLADSKELSMLNINETGVSEALLDKIHTQTTIGSIIENAIEGADYHQKEHSTSHGELISRREDASDMRNEPAQEYDMTATSRKPSREGKVRRSARDIPRPRSNESGDGQTTLNRQTKVQGTPTLGDSGLGTDRGTIRQSKDYGIHTTSLEVQLMMRDQAIQSQPLSPPGKAKLLSTNQINALLEYYRRNFLQSMSIDAMKDYLCRPVRVPTFGQRTGLSTSVSLQRLGSLHTQWEDGYSSNVNVGASQQISGITSALGTGFETTDPNVYRYKQRSNHKGVISDIRSGTALSSRSDKDLTLTRKSERASSRQNKSRNTSHRQGTTTRLGGAEVRRLPSAIERALDQRQSSEMNEYFEEFTKIMGYAPPGGLQGWLFLQGLYSQYMDTKRLQVLQANLEELSVDKMPQISSAQQQADSSPSRLQSNDTFVEDSMQIGAKELRRQAYARSNTWLKNKRARKQKASTQEVTARPTLPSVHNYRQKIVEKQLKNLKDSLRNAGEGEDQTEEKKMSQSSVWQMQMKYAQFLRERALDFNSYIRGSQSVMEFSNISPRKVDPMSKSLIHLQGKGVQNINLANLNPNVERARNGGSGIVMPAVATQSSASSRGYYTSSRTPLIAVPNNHIQKLKCEIPSPDRRRNQDFINQLNPSNKQKTTPHMTSSNHSYSLSKFLTSQSHVMLPSQVAALQASQGISTEIADSVKVVKKGSKADQMNQTALTVKPQSIESHHDDEMDRRGSGLGLSGSMPQSSILLAEGAKFSGVVSPDKTRIFIENQNTQGSGNRNFKTSYNKLPQQELMSLGMRSKSQERVMRHKNDFARAPTLPLVGDHRQFQLMTGIQVTDESPLQGIHALGGFGQEASSLMLADASRDLNHQSSVVMSSSGPAGEVNNQTGRQLSLAHKTERQEANKPYGKRTSIIPENLHSSLGSERTEVKQHSRIDSSNSNNDLPLEIRRQSGGSHPYKVQQINLLKKANQLSLYRSGDQYTLDSVQDSAGTQGNPPILSTSIIKHKAMTSQGQRRAGSNTVIENSFANNVAQDGLLLHQNTQKMVPVTAASEAKVNVRSERAGSRRTAQPVFSTSRPKSVKKDDIHDTARRSSRSSKSKKAASKPRVRSSGRESRNTLNNGGTLPPINIVGSQQNEASSNHDLSQVMTPRGGCIALDLRTNRKVSLKKTDDSTARTGTVALRKTDREVDTIPHDRDLAQLDQNSEHHGQDDANRPPQIDLPAEGTAALMYQQQQRNNNSSQGNYRITELTSAQARTSNAIGFASNLVTPPLVERVLMAKTYHEENSNSFSRNPRDVKKTTSRGNLSKDSLGRPMPWTQQNWRNNDSASSIPTLAQTQKPRAEIIRKTILSRELSRLQQRQLMQQQSPANFEPRKASEASQLANRNASESFLPLQVNVMRRPEAATGTKDVQVSQRESGGFISVSTLITKKATRSHVLLPGLRQNQTQNATSEENGPRRKQRKKLISSKSALKISGEATGLIIPPGVTKAELISSIYKTRQEPVVPPAPKIIQTNNLQVNLKPENSVSNEVSDRKLQPMGTSDNQQDYDNRSMDVQSSNPIRFAAVTDQTIMIAQQGVCHSLETDPDIQEMPVRESSEIVASQNKTHFSQMHTTTEYRKTQNDASFRELRQTSYGFPVDQHQHDSDQKVAKIEKEPVQRRKSAESKKRVRKDSAGSGPWDAKKDSVTSELSVQGTRKTMVGRAKERGSDVGLSVEDQLAAQKFAMYNSLPRQSFTGQQNILDHRSVPDMLTPQQVNRIKANNSISHDPAYDGSKDKTGATRAVYREHSSDMTSSHQNMQIEMAPVPAIFKNSTSVSATNHVNTLALVAKNNDLPDYMDGVELIPVTSSKVTPAQSTKRLNNGLSTEEPSLEHPMANLPPAMINNKNLFASIIESESQRVIQNENAMNEMVQLPATDRSANKKNTKNSSKRNSLHSETGSVIIPIDQSMPIMLFNDSFAGLQHQDSSLPNVKSPAKNNEQPVSQGNQKAGSNASRVSRRVGSATQYANQEKSAIKAVNEFDQTQHVPRGGMRGSKLSAKRSSIASFSKNKM